MDATAEETSPVFLKNFPEDPFAPKAKQVLHKLEGGHRQGGTPESREP